MNWRRDRTTKENRWRSLPINRDWIESASRESKQDLVQPSDQIINEYEHCQIAAELAISLFKSGAGAYTILGGRLGPYGTAAGFVADAVAEQLDQSEAAAGLATMG